MISIYLPIFCLVLLPSVALAQQVHNANTHPAAQSLSLPANHYHNNNNNNLRQNGSSINSIKNDDGDDDCDCDVTNDKLEALLNRVDAMEVGFRKEIDDLKAQLEEQNAIIQDLEEQRRLQFRESVSGAICSMQLVDDKCEISKDVIFNAPVRFRSTADLSFTRITSTRAIEVRGPVNFRPYEGFSRINFMHHVNVLDSFRMATPIADSETSFEIEGNVHMKFISPNPTYFDTQTNFHQDVQLVSADDAASEQPHLLVGGDVTVNNDITSHNSIQQTNANAVSKFEGHVNINGATSMQSLAANGHLDLNGDMYVTGKTQLKSDVEVRGGLVVEGEQSHFHNDLAVEGEFSINNLRVEENLSVVGEAAFETNVIVDGGLEVRGETTNKFVGGLEIGQGLEVLGETTSKFVGDLEIGANIEVLGTSTNKMVGSLDIGSNLAVTGAARFKSSAHVTGNLQLSPGAVLAASTFINCADDPFNTYCP